MSLFVAYLGNSAMRSVFSAVFISGAMILTGCSRPAPVPHRLSVEDIIDKIHCELHNAVWREHHSPRRARLHASSNGAWARWWTGWKATITLKLQTARDAGAESSGSFSVPIHRGRFTLGYLAGFNKKATNSTTFSFDVYMDELGPNPPKERKTTYKFDPERCYELELVEGRRKRLLAGNLGLTDWLRRASGAYRKTRTMPTGQTYFVEFLITHNGSATPGVDIMNPTGERFIINVKVSGKKVKTHQLTVVLGRVKAVQPDAQLAVLNDILDVLEKQNERKFTQAEIDEIEREISKLPERSLLMTKKENERNTLKEKINEIDLKIDAALRQVRRQAVQPRAIEDNTQIRQLQILDALSRIDTNN